MALIKSVRNSGMLPMTSPSNKHGNEEIGHFIARMQDNLSTMKEQLGSMSGAGVKEIECLKSIIEKTELEVHHCKEHIVNSNNDKPLEIQLHTQPSVKSKVKLEGANKITDKRSPNRGFEKLSPGKQLKDFLRLKAIINPRNELSRKILNETYAIPMPVARSRVYHEETKYVTPKRKSVYLPPIQPSTDTNSNSNVDPNSGLKVFDPTLNSSLPKDISSPISGHFKTKVSNSVFLTSGREHVTPSCPTSNVTRSSEKHSTKATVPLPSPYSDNRNRIRLVIYKGFLSRTSYDFEQFRKFYHSSWGSISMLLAKLEKLAKDYSIPVAFIDIDSLLDISLYFEETLNPSTDDLLLCLQNKDDVEKLIKLPGRRFLAEDGKEVAASLIQAGYRMFRERKKYLKHRRQTRAAGLIALSWVMICKKTLIRKQLQKSKLAHLQRFRLRFATMKRNWSKIQQSRRVVIHIPSAGFDRQVRERCPDISSYENCQLGRIFDIVDEKTEIIYVSPLHISDEVKEYYLKLLSIRGTETKERTEVPVKFVIPDAIGQFPGHNFPLATIIKYSRHTLQRLRNMIKGKVAYMVPGVISYDDLYAADMLDVGILGTEPDISQLYSTKSGRRRIFESSGVSCTPGDYNIFSIEQLYESLAKLVTNNLDAHCWYFRIDNEFNERGTAYCYVTNYLSCYQAALKERERYGVKWEKPWAWEPTFRKILEEIPIVLNEHAKPVNGEIWPSWSVFFRTFLATGGVVEGSAPSENTTVISVDALIEPTGNVVILSSADEVYTAGTSPCAGYTVPQLSVSPDVLIASSHKIAKACIERGIYGFIAISFITFMDSRTEKQELWVSDLKLTYSESLCMSRILQYITNGKLDPAISAFKVPIVDRQGSKGSRRRAKSQDHEAPCQVKYIDRYAVVSSSLFHSDMKNVRYGVLFQLCKALGIGFDKDDKVGTLFNLLDERCRERFGMIVISQSLQEAISMFAFNLSALHQQISSTFMPPVTNTLDVVEALKAILTQTDENILTDGLKSIISTTQTESKKEGKESKHVVGTETITVPVSCQGKADNTQEHTAILGSNTHPSPVSDL